MSSQLEVRSFRSVFSLERRIYQIDTLRLNPGGVPLRGLAYAALLVIASLLAGVLPPASWLDPLIPWYARNIGLPIALAVLMGSIRLEGRPFHLAATAIAGHLLRPRRVCALTRRSGRRPRWSPPDIILIPDGSDARLRTFRYRGPGAVLVTAPHRQSAVGALRRADVELRPRAGGWARPAVVDLRPGILLEVRGR